ncbi:hypothetical protein BP6252_00109 [Coleophoma cylindrospora]|uniref:F-box domain-containing protein n=1 Tax=Coleophoma cylindrospora TaxID=1849047 RepID=A0A3D8SP50_9HELO|nr:hypothetical protein BP6252_00109 [Coleophoma cylindrospora]
MAVSIAKVPRSQDATNVTNSLPTEVIQYMYSFLPIHGILSLSQISRRFHNAYMGHQLPILEKSVRESYGPIPDLVKLVVANEPDIRSRAKLLSARNRASAHVRRIIQVPEKPTLTVELIFKMIQYGEIAEQWVEVWPRIHWREDSENRRLLEPHEQTRLRAAVYRFWTYNSLFHHNPFHPSVVEDPTRLTMARPWDDDPRLMYLRTYNTLDILLLDEFARNMHQVIGKDLCPSNATIMKRYQHFSRKAVDSMGWGEDYSHGRLVQVLMKLRPREILYLLEHTTTKAERINYLVIEGGKFQDTPSTLSSAINTVKHGRNFAPLGYFGRNLYWGIVDPPTPRTPIVGGLQVDLAALSKDANPDGAWPKSRDQFLPPDGAWVDDEDSDGGVL